MELLNFLIALALVGLTWFATVRLLAWSLAWSLAREQDTGAQVKPLPDNRRLAAIHIGRHASVR